MHPDWTIWTLCVDVQNGIAGSFDTTILSFLEECPYGFPKVEPVDISIINKFLLIYIHANIGWFCSLWCESHCCDNVWFAFPCCGAKHFFHILIDNLYAFFEEIPINLFLFFIKLLIFLVNIFPVLYICYILTRKGKYYILVLEVSSLIIIYFSYRSFLIWWSLICLSLLLLPWPMALNHW